MKKILMLVLSIAALSTVSAQSQSSYFMSGSYQRNLLNPALAPDRGALSLPVIGGVSVNTLGNLSLDDLLYSVDGELVTLLDSRVTSDMLLSNMEAANTMYFDSRINLLSFGSYTRNGKNFWSFDVNTRIMGGVSVPYELFDFSKNLGGLSFNDLDISADTFIEAGFSYSFPVIDNLYIGIRAKALIGYARANMAISSANIAMGSEEWTMDATGYLQTSGAMFNVESQYNDDGEEYVDLDSIDFNTDMESLTTTAGLGFAADLGASYTLLDGHLQVSASVLDLGYMSWKEEFTYRGEAVVSDFSFSGVDVSADGSTTTNMNIPEFEFQSVSNGESLGQMLNATINVGAEYNFFSNKIGAGVLYSRRKIYDWTDNSLLLSARVQPVKWFTILGSYDFLDENVFGLALNFSPCWINFFIATDVALAQKTPQYIPIEQSNMNLTMGLSLPLGRRGVRNQ